MVRMSHPETCTIHSYPAEIWQILVRASGLPEPTAADLDVHSAKWPVFEPSHIVEEDTTIVVAVLLLTACDRNLRVRPFVFARISLYFRCYRWVQGVTPSRASDRG